MYEGLIVPERPLQAIMVPEWLRPLRIEDFPIPSPNAEGWLHNTAQIARFREILTPRWRKDQPAQSILLAAPTRIWLEILLAKLLEAIREDFRRLNQGLAPNVTGAAEGGGPRFAVYLPVAGFALLLASRGLSIAEQRLRANLPEATALLLPDLHALPRAVQREAVELLLARNRGQRPWFATWEGPMEGPFWELVSRQAEVLRFQT